jgi:hypothetical protein
MSSKNPVVILYPSKTLQSHMDTIVPATRLIIASSHSPDPAKRFDLGDEFTPIVEEAKRLYQKVWITYISLRLDLTLSVDQVSIGTPRGILPWRGVPTESIRRKAPRHGCGTNRE